HSRRCCAMPASRGPASSAWPVASWHCIRAGGCECVEDDSLRARITAPSSPAGEGSFGSATSTAGRGVRTIDGFTPLTHHHSWIHPHALSRPKGRSRPSSRAMGRGRNNELRVIAAFAHLSRLARAGFVFAREGVLALIDPKPLPMPARTALWLARL